MWHEEFRPLRKDLHSLLLTPPKGAEEDGQEARVGLLPVPHVFPAPGRPLLWRGGVGVAVPTGGGVVWGVPPLGGKVGAGALGVCPDRFRRPEPDLVPGHPPLTAAPIAVSVLLSLPLPMLREVVHTKVSHPVFKCGVRRGVGRLVAAILARIVVVRRFLKARFWWLDRVPRGSAVPSARLSMHTDLNTNCAGERPNSIKVHQGVPSHLTVLNMQILIAPSKLR